MVDESLLTRRNAKGSTGRNLKRAMRLYAQRNDQGAFEKILDQYGCLGDERADAIQAFRDLRTLLRG